VSQYFLLGDLTLWNPSNGVSALFLRQTAGFEEMLGLPSGMGPMEEDEARIVPDVLEGFIAALLAWRDRSNHAVLGALSDGFVATMLVLADRSGVAVRWPGPHGAACADLHDVQVGMPPGTAGVDAGWTVRVREQARQLDRAMAW